MGTSRFEIKALTLGEILDEAFRLFRAGLLPFLLFQLILAVPSTAAFAWLMHAAGEILIEMVASGQFPVARAVRAGVLTLSAMFLLTCVVAPLSSVALTRSVSELYLGREFRVGTMLRHALRLGPRAIWVWTVLLALVTLIFLSWIAVLGVAYGFALSMIRGADIAGLIGLGVLALLTGLLLSVLGGYFYLRYALAVTAVAVEDLSGRAALARSRQLMRGRYLRALALYGVIFTISALAGGAISAFVPSPSFEALDLEVVKALVPQLVRSQILSMTLGQVVGLVTGPYSTICATLFYFSARCEEEGFDLTHLAERLARGL